MQRNYLKDAKRVYDVLKKGGIAIVYMRNAYAIMSGTDGALKKVYTAKKRSLNRPSGLVANARTHEKLHILSKEKKNLSSFRLIDINDMDFLTNYIFDFLWQP